jgi:hypothetical protein
MAEYVLNLKVDKLQGVGQRRAKSLVTRFTRRTFNYSQTRVPVDTGYLRASGSTSIETGTTSVVGTIIYTAEYAAAVHNGRRALTIRPHNPSGYLWFTVGGKRVRAKEVHQPARKGRPYLANALQKAAGSSRDFQVRIGAGAPI